jgi:hypothetical protein
MADDTITKISLVDPIQVNVAIPNFEGKAGRDGTDGRDGDDAYRVAVRNGFIGTEQEWLASLKGGKPSTAEQARNKLLENNIWCDDSTVDSVLSALLGNWGKPMPRTDYKPMTLQSTILVGNPNLTFVGEPHFKLKVDNKTVEFGSNGLAEVSVSSSNAGDSYVAQYFGYVDNHISDINVSFGRLASVFDKGSLVETKELSLGGSDKVSVSIYNNKVVELNHVGDKNNQPTLGQSEFQKIKNYVKTKVSDIDTLIIDDALTSQMWATYSGSSLKNIAQGIGHGVNLRLDFSYYQAQGYGSQEEKFFSRVASDDNRSKWYIGKAIQVGDSNVMIIKPTGWNIVYRYNTNTIMESQDAL